MSETNRNSTRTSAVPPPAQPIPRKKGDCAHPSSSAARTPEVDGLWRSDAMIFAIAIVAIGGAAIVGLLLTGNAGR